MIKPELKDGAFIKMDEETKQQLDKLNAKFNEEKSLFIAGLKQLIADQQEEIDTLKVEMAAVRHNLEATKRERDEVSAVKIDLESQVEELERIVSEMESGGEI